jgi:colanic acid biosynthesis glycosyl transferase WcaI
MKSLESDDLRMNIALICHVYAPEVAPAGGMVRELAEDLVAAGHRVTVLTGWPNHPRGILYEGWRSRFRQLARDPKGFRVLRCGHSIHPRKKIFWRLWYYLTFGLGTFVNGLACGRMDAVLCLSTPIFGLWTAWMLARLKGARFVYDIFDLHPEAAHHAGLIGRGLAYTIWRAIDTLLCRRSDVIATLSEGMKREIVARGIEPDKVAVVPFWMDAETVSPGPRDNAWRRRQRIPLDRFVALYAGTIGYISGAEVLIETAHLLSDRPDILILCVGEGVVKDKIERRAAELGLANIRFLPFQPAEMLDDMMATADVGLVTLLAETGKTSVPSKILGYMAAGRAVVASVAEDCATARVIQEGECGIVTPCQDPAALADALRRAADDRDTTRRLGENARRCLLDRYSRKHCTGLYETLLAGGQG